MNLFVDMWLVVGKDFKFGADGRASLDIVDTANSFQKQQKSNPIDEPSLLCRCKGVTSIASTLPPLD